MLSLKKIKTEMPPWPDAAQIVKKYFDGQAQAVYEFETTRAERKVLKTPRRIKVSRHAERYRVLTMSSMPGPWRNHITPYLVDIMDAAAESCVETVIICKAPQTGGSEGAHNFIHYAIDRDPGPVMYVFPDEQTARENARDRIRPMIESSAKVRRYLLPGRDDVSSIRINLKHMPIYMSWATSPTKLANKPIKHIIFDEVDKYPASSGKREADPISLGEKRTITFSSVCKKWKISSPTTESGYIWKALTEEAQVIFDYWVKCPGCGQHQVMVFEKETFRVEESEREPERIETLKLAWYECIHCQARWDDRLRNEAVQHGQWRTREASGVPSGIEIFTYLKSHRPKKIGFHLPSWLSYFISLSTVMASFFKGQQQGFEKFKDFKNSHEAKPWVQKIVHYEESRLLDARVDLPPQTVPEAAVALTCGIDHQLYGFWFVVRAWAANYTSWLIHYGQLADWTDLEELLFNTFYPIEGTDKKMRIVRAGLDTGGTMGKSGLSMTEEAYLWLRKNGRGRGCNVWGTKGSATKLASKIKVGNSKDKTPAGKPLKSGLKIVMLNTQDLKDMVHYRHNQALLKESQAAYLHAETKMDWVNQVMLSEEKQRDAKGHEAWVAVKRENHMLDCECIAQVVADPEWITGGIHIYGRKIIKPKPQAPPVRRPANLHQGERPSWLQ